MKDFVAAYKQAVDQQDLNRIRELIDGGMDVNYCDAEGVSPLMMAVYGFDADNISHFLSLDANVNQRDNYGNTPLHYLFVKSHLQRKQLWLGERINLEVPLNFHVRTLFPREAMLRVIEQFLSNGVDLSFTNDSGLTVADEFRYDSMIDEKFQRDIIEMLESHVENKTLDSVIESDDAATGVLF